jgi:hypothetical protein
VFVLVASGIHSYSYAGLIPFRTHNNATCILSNTAFVVNCRLNARFYVQMSAILVIIIIKVVYIALYHLNKYYALVPRIDYDRNFGLCICVIENEEKIDLYKHCIHPTQIP